jgi:predicted ATP-grasp superfamily ATP-dependent carboligase
MAQALVAGDETHIVSYHAYIDSDGEVAGEFTGRKIRTYPAEFGMSCALITTDDEPLARAGRDLVARLGLVGPAKLDFKRAANGRLNLLEVNPRFTLWAHPGAVAGVNLPAIAWADLTGAPRPRMRKARPGVRWIKPRDDLAAARERGVPLMRWLPWAIRCESNQAFAWNDPAPAIRHHIAH